MSQLINQAQQYTPGGVHSPVRACTGMGVAPLFLTHATGPYVVDHQGQQYVDYICGFGPTILGHGHPAISKAVTQQAQQGLVYGISDVKAPILSQYICEAFPSVEQVRLMNSGTEACMTAVRLARAATQRPKVIKFEGTYHGHHDAFLVSAGSGAMNTVSTSGVTVGATQDTVLLPFNDIVAVEQAFKTDPKAFAAIMIEPIAGNMGMILPKTGYLKALRQLCDQYGVMLIFDEVMTGFRVAYGGASVHYDIRPDLVVLGKVIGGGLPIGAVAGPRAILSLLAPIGPVYQAGTFSANPMSLSAGIATFQQLQVQGVYEGLTSYANALCEGLVKCSAACDVPLQCVSLGGMLGLFFSEQPVECLTDAQASNLDQFKLFYRTMREQGVLWPPSPYEAFFIGTQHDDETLRKTLEAARYAFKACSISEGVH